MADSVVKQLGRVAMIVSDEGEELRPWIYVDACPGFVTVGGHALTVENAVKLANLLYSAAKTVAS